VREIVCLVALLARMLSPIEMGESLAGLVPLNWG
jgi:hypothetical protein